jgi:hypothetical protein
VATIVLLDLTDVSGGNALGIGFADFIPAALANDRLAEDLRQLLHRRAAGVRRARMPMVLPDEEACIKAALSMCGRGLDEPKRVVRIESHAAPHPVLGERGAAAVSSRRRDLVEIVGASNVFTDADVRAGYETDWTRRYHGTCAAVVRPGSTAEVAAVIAACAEHGATVVTQGGNTGLVGGGVPRAVSDDRRADRASWSPSTRVRLTELGPVDVGAAQVTVGAGVTLGGVARPRPGRRPRRARSTSPPATRPPSAAPSPPTPAARGWCGSARCASR